MQGINPIYAVVRCLDTINGEFLRGFNNCKIVSLYEFAKIKLQFMNIYYGGKVALTLVIKKVYVLSSVNDCLMIVSLIEERHSYIILFHLIIVLFCFGCVCLYPTCEINRL